MAKKETENGENAVGKVKHMDMMGFGREGAPLTFEDYQCPQKGVWAEGPNILIFQKGEAGSGEKY